MEVAHLPLFAMQVLSMCDMGPVRENIAEAARGCQDGAFQIAHWPRVDRELGPQVLAAFRTGQDETHLADFRPRRPATHCHRVLVAESRPDGEFSVYLTLSSIHLSHPTATQDTSAKPLVCTGRLAFPMDCGTFG
jgi:hypothetical protein